MREKILEIAEGQMKAGGYANLNFSVISKELNTTRANLHYHFKNKETLALEVTKRFIADQRSDLMKLAAQFPGDFAGLVTGLESMHWSYYEEHGPVGGCVCQQMIRESSIPESLVSLSTEHFNEFRSLMIEQVIESQKLGKLKSDIHPMEIALEAGCLLMGLGQMTLFMAPSEVKMAEGTLRRWVAKYKN